MVSVRRGFLFLLVALAHAIASAQGPISAGKVLPFVPPKRWALLIGAGEYETLGRLEFAPRDAQEFAKVLVGDFRFQPDSVETLADGKDAKPPTAQHIRETLDRILNDTRFDKGDLFVFYFAGHGIGTPNGDFLAPTDATEANVEKLGVPVKEVVQRFVKAGLKNVLLICDACRAGKENNFGAELRDLSEKTNIAVYLGCQPGKRSYQYAKYRHGAFTYMLLKALRDPALRDPATGALWASRVGAQIAQKVEALTEPDYGEFKQVPVNLADDRRDVLLGAFPSGAVTEEALKVFQQDTARLDAEHHAAALTAYADKLYELDDDRTASDLLKVADSLSPLDDMSRYVLASALSFSGRSTEAHDQFKRLAASENKVIRYLSIASNTETGIALSERAAAAIELVKVEPSFSFAYMASQVAAVTGTPAQKIEVVQLILRSVILTDRERAFFEAELARHEGRIADAEQAYRKTLTIDGSTIVAEMLYLRLFTLYTETSQAAKIGPLCEEALKHKSEAAVWHLIHAQWLKKAGQMDEAMQQLKAALTQPMDPQQVLLCVNIAGLRTPEIAPKLREKANLYPRAWEATTALAILDGLDKKGYAVVFEAFQRAAEYVQDMRKLALAIEQTLDPMLEEGFAAGRVAPETYRDLLVIRSGAIVTMADEIGDESELWWFLLYDGLRCFRTMQVAQLFNLHLGRDQVEGRLSRDLEAYYTVAAFNAADWPRFDALGKQSRALGADRGDLDIFRSAAAVVRGKEAEAKTIYGGIRDHSPEHQQTFDALGVLLKGGKVDTTKFTEPAAKALIGLAMLKSGPSEEAAELIAGKEEISWGWQAIHLFARTQLHNALRKAGRSEPADFLCWAAQFSFVGSPLVESMHYAQKPSFTGQYHFKARVIDDDTAGAEDEFTLTVAADGTVKGTMLQSPFSGKVDANGNLKGKVLNWEVIAKLAPVSYYTTYERLKGEGQVFVMLNPKGLRLIAACTPK